MFDLRSACRWALIFLIGIIIGFIPVYYIISVESRIFSLEIKVISLEMKINSNKLLAQETMRKVVPDDIALKGEIDG